MSRARRDGPHSDAARSGACRRCSTGTSATSSRKVVEHGAVLGGCLHLPRLAGGEIGDLARAASAATHRLCREEPVVDQACARGAGSSPDPCRALRRSLCSCAVRRGTRAGCAAAAWTPARAPRRRWPAACRAGDRESARPQHKRLTNPNHSLQSGAVTDRPTPAEAIRRRGGLWHHLDFRRLWIGETVSQFGTFVSQLALPLVAILVLHASTFEVGLLATFELLAFLVVGLPAGAWVDRMRFRWVLIVNDLIRAVALGSIPLAQLFGILTIGQLYAVAILTGLSTVFFDVAYQSYLPALVDREALVEGNSKLQASESVSQIAGPGRGRPAHPGVHRAVRDLDRRASASSGRRAGSRRSGHDRRSRHARQIVISAARSSRASGSSSATGCCARSRRVRARPTCSRTWRSPSTSSCSRATCICPPE